MTSEVRHDISKSLPAPGAISPRTDWVDAARGVGIILVVYGHVLRSMMTSGSLPDAGIWAAQDRAIYAFHMPLFFLLAGLFAERGIVRGRGAFLIDKLATVVWPYLLWSLLNGGLQMLFARHVHDPASAATLGAIWWRPVDQFWFLYALLLCQLAAAATLPRLALLSALAAMGIAWFAQGLASNIMLMAAFELPYFVAGVAVARWGLTRADVTPRTAALVASAGWAIYAGLLLTADLRALPASYATGLAGIAGTAALCMGWLRHVAVLRALGRASMAIYVAHVIVTAGLRIVAEHSGIAVPPLALLAVSTIAGLLLPWLLFAWARRTGWSAALGLGRRVGAARPARVTDRTP